MCALDGAKPVLCEAIEAYVNECQDRGITVGPWRNESFCRKCRKPVDIKMMYQCYQTKLEVTQELVKGF